MNSHRYERVISAMTVNKTQSNSLKFLVSVNGVDDIFIVDNITNDGWYYFKSTNNGDIHSIMHIPPFHIKYRTNNIEYIFKSEM